MEKLIDEKKDIKVAFLSSVAFDANVSLINALGSFCDIYFVTEACHEKFNHLKKDKLEKVINRGIDVEQINIFSKLIDLKKTFVIKGVQQRFILKKLYNSIKISFLLKKIKPDVIVIDSAGLTYLFSVLFNRKKTLLLVHDPFLHTGGAFFIDRVLRKVFFRLITKKMLLNNSQKKSFIDFYKQKENDIYVSFLSTYKYLTCYESDNKIGSEKAAFNILFFGGISPYKGLKYLFDAFLDLPVDIRDKMQLTIAGGGFFNFEPYKNFKNINIINEFVQPEHLASLIKKSDVVVCPYTDATQSGVVMSAYAFYKPIIATNVGGLPEMVIHEKTGVIIEPKNISALRDAILYLYNNRDVLKQMENGIIEIYENGSKNWSASALKFMEAFNDIVQKK